MKENEATYLFGVSISSFKRYARAVFKENGPLIETRRVLSLLYSLNAEGSFLVKVHPFREKLLYGPFHRQLRARTTEVYR
jgi:hypothetical protein